MSLGNINKVDNVPTSGSDALITSGGVKAAISGLIQSTTFSGTTGTYGESPLICPERTNAIAVHLTKAGTTVNPTNIRIDYCSYGGYLRRICISFMSSGERLTNTAIEGIAFYISE